MREFYETQIVFDLIHEYSIINNPFSIYKLPKSLVGVEGI
jgi:hypothetical protein